MLRKTDQTQLTALQSPNTFFFFILIFPTCSRLTSCDLTHGGDGRVVGRDSAQGLGLHRGVSRDAQHQGEQPLVPPERLLGQLAARQGGGEGQVQLEEKGRR
jgi:hypothetical protein